MAAFGVNFIGAGAVAERIITNAGSTGFNVGGSTVTTAGTVTLPTNRILKITSVISNFQGAAGIIRLRAGTALTGGLILSLFFATAGQIVMENLNNPIQIVSDETADAFVITEGGVASANETTILGKIN